MVSDFTIQVPDAAKGWKWLNMKGFRWLMKKKQLLNPPISDYYVKKGITKPTLSLWANISRLPNKKKIKRKYSCSKQIFLHKNSHPLSLNCTNFSRWDPGFDPLPHSKKELRQQAASF